MRPFSPYPNSFDGNTLGWWRFGERGGRLDNLIPGGPAMDNVGADPQDDGYRFVRASADYMEAFFPGQPDLYLLTLEMWVRRWAVPVGEVAVFAMFQIPYYPSSIKFLRLSAFRNSNPNYSFIRASACNVGVTIEALWLDQMADDLLASAEPWHVAAVLDGSSLKLFVNGVQRVYNTYSTGLPAGDYDLFLGWDPGVYLHDPDYHLDAVLDEVRLSSCARYSDDFSIARFAEGRRAVVRGPGLADVCAGVAG
jgi:hypothetical protein